MKKILTILISFAAIVAASSCSEDFIKKDKPFSLTEDLIFSNPEFIENNLLGCYTIFKSTYPTFMDGKVPAIADSRGDDIINVSNPVTLQHTYQMQVLSTEAENTDLWVYAYFAINYSNLFADKLVKYNCQEVLGQEKFDQFFAEARFIRAYSYYVLCQLYSEPYCKNPNALAVPLRLKGLESSGNNNCPESTIAQIYAQILEDCMPSKLPADEDVAGDKTAVSRASAAAAHLLRMRVYMAMQEWDNAIAEGDAIDGFTLAEDVASLYGIEDVAASKEMIFALPQSVQDKPNTQNSLAEFFSPQADICSIDEENGIASITGYFLDADQRVSKLVEQVGDLKYSTKYMDYGGHLDWVPLMRFAEVKLNLAECYANKAGGTTSARTNLTDVRRRAIAEEDDVISIDDLSGESLKEAVYNERRIEFLAEGMRGFDIMRRGGTFSKHNKYVDLDVAPGDNGYVWPIPDQEKSYNKEIIKK